MFTDLEDAGAARLHGLAPALRVVIYPSESHGARASRRAQRDGAATRTGSTTASEEIRELRLQLRDSEQSRVSPGRFRPSRRDHRDCRSSAMLRDGFSIWR